MTRFDYYYNSYLCTYYSFVIMFQYTDNSESVKILSLERVLILLWRERISLISLDSGMSIKKWVICAHTTSSTKLLTHSKFTIWWWSMIYSTHTNSESTLPFELYFTVVWYHNINSIHFIFDVYLGSMSHLWQLINFLVLSIMGECKELGWIYIQKYGHSFNW